MKAYVELSGRARCYRYLFLVERLDGLRKVRDDGGVYFEGDPLFEDVVGILESAVELSGSVPDANRRRIVSDALFGAPADEPLTDGLLLGEMGRREQEFLLEAEQEFVLVTSLSVGYFGGLDETEISGRRISLRRSTPEPFRKGHEEAKGMARRYVFGDYPDPLLPSGHYTAVAIRTRGRSVPEAAEAALGALDLLRGLWNLALNSRRWSRTSARRRRPVNEVLRGPVHSLHHPDGSFVGIEGVWYEHDYVEPVQSRELERHWEETKEFEDEKRSELTRNAPTPVGLRTS